MQSGSLFKLVFLIAFCGGSVLSQKPDYEVDGTMSLRRKLGFANGNANGNANFGKNGKS